MRTDVSATKKRIVSITENRILTFLFSEAILHSHAVAVFDVPRTSRHLIPLRTYFAIVLSTSRFLPLCLWAPRGSFLAASNSTAGQSYWAILMPSYHVILPAEASLPHLRLHRACLHYCHHLRSALCSVALILIPPAHVSRVQLSLLLLTQHPSLNSIEQGRPKTVLILSLHLDVLQYLRL